MVMMILYLLLMRDDKRRITLIPVALLALIFGHLAVAIIFGFLVGLLMILNSKLLINKLNKKFIILYIFFFIIIIVVLFVEMTYLKKSVEMLWRGITSLIIEANARTASEEQSFQPISTVLSYIPISVIVATSFVSLFISTIPSWLRTLTAITLVSVGMAFFAEQALPGITAVRYIGYPAAVILSITLPLGLHKLSKRGRLGSICTTVLIIVVILAFVFSGSLTPGNPLTGVPSFGVYGLIAYDENVQIKMINQLLTGKIQIVTDWRTGLFLGYLNALDLKRMSYGVETENLTIANAGAYGFIVSEERLVTMLKRGYVLILRDKGLDMIESFTRDLKIKLKNLIHNTNIIYNGEKMVVTSNYIES
ncbi:hypothetical protein Pogu_2054 [Pyrobaculum oguniense TE7]|uniref:Uncharacterized protein n=1 Tax=Pyrobaculum oguniense (strain DSM 13380 / JCM 10595 / TE7) TaxID=698757 RepID=H6QB84_PYROT|nr:hypothetical protein Pogu_2054 [Pyrobaculum oguniense TE7]